AQLTARAVRHTQRFAAEHRWAAYHSVRHTGVVRFLVVRHLATSAQALVNLVAAPGEVPAAERWAQEIAALDPQIRGVVLNRNSSRANIAFGEPGQERALAPAPPLPDRLPRPVS